MKLLAVITALLIVLLSYGQNLNCDVAPVPLYTDCQVDLTIAIDMSIATGNQNDVDALVSSVYNLVSRYAYGSNTATSIITFGTGVIDRSNFFNNFGNLCQFINAELIHSHQTGLHAANLVDVLDAYTTSQPANARQCQRVLILLTAIDDQNQVSSAEPVADALKANHVQIITVTVGKFFSDYLYLLGNDSYSSMTYNIDSATLDKIGYSSCLNSGHLYTTAPLNPSSTKPVTVYTTKSTYPSSQSTTPGATFTTTTYRFPQSSVKPPSTTPVNIYTTTTYPSPQPSVTPSFNNSDGRLCAADSRNAWLDIVLVLELSSATAPQWNAIMASTLSYISQLSLNNTALICHSSRIALVGYTDATEAQLLFTFTDTQQIRNIQFALNYARPPADSADTANIASGLRLAGTILDKNRSFRVQGVVLYAATYDNLGNHNPVIAAKELKANMIKIVTVSYEAQNGVTTQRISDLASPGLALTSKDSIVVFGKTIALLNCRCPPGWTPFVVGNTTYGECFFYEYAQTLEAFAACDGGILALTYTPARLDFLTKFVTTMTDVPTDSISIGLNRTNDFSAWTWQNDYPYSGYPPFAQTPSDTATFGYLSDEDTPGNWQLYADDGFKDSRYYVCQTDSCDTDNFCDLTGN